PPEGRPQGGHGVRVRHPPRRRRAQGLALPRGGRFLPGPADTEARGIGAMTVYITEHSGQVSQERQAVGPPLASYSLSSVSTPVLPNAKTNFIRVSADAASLVSFFSSSTTVTGQLTSTLGLRVPANMVERFQLSNNS